MNEIMECETCKKTVNETPIIEKPLRVAFRSNVSKLKQNTNDYRKQENICMDCLKNEINGTTVGHRKNIKIKN